MKILVNVARELLHEDWSACEGVQLKECDDGSFDLLITRNLERTRAAAKVAAEARA